MIIKLNLKIREILRNQDTFKTFGAGLLYFD